jgi:hypothetical protein
MKSTLIHSRVMLAAAVVAVVSSGPIFAADLPKEGGYDITSCFTRVSNLITFSKTHTASSFEQIGVALSNPPGGLFDKESIRCVGSSTSFDGNATFNNICEAIDKDGNKRLTRFHYESDTKMVRETVTGTGMYEGMVVIGTYQAIGPFPTIKSGTSHFCNRQTGTYKLK